MTFASDCLASTGLNLGGVGLALALLIGAGIALLIVGRTLRSKITVLVLLALGLTLGGLGGLAGNSAPPAQATSQSCGSTPAPSDSSSSTPQAHVTFHFISDNPTQDTSGFPISLTGDVRFCEGLSTTTNCVTVPASSPPGTEVTLTLTSSPARINVLRNGLSCLIYTWNSEPSWHDADQGNGNNDFVNSDPGVLAMQHSYSNGDTIYWINYDLCLA